MSLCRGELIMKSEGRHADGGDLDGAGSVLEGRELVKLFRGRGTWRGRVVRAVDGVSVTVRAGETIGIVGESGCGKSTLARLLLGLEKPETGVVLFKGLNVSTLDAEQHRDYRRGAQMIFQNPQQSFNPMFTVGWSIRDGLRLTNGLSRSEKKWRAGELLEKVGLDKSLQFRTRDEVSGGELQRAALARALAVDPEVLVLDEPTSALDASVQGQIVQVLLDLQTELRLGYLLITHDMRIVRMMAQHVIVMYLGQIVETGTTQEILTAPRHPYTISLLSATAIGRPARQGALLQGEARAVSDTYQGCRFASRCRFQTEGCEEVQALNPYGGRMHRVRCWRCEEIAVSGAAGSGLSGASGSSSGVDLGVS
jgi:oligopeptide/dipeptide ABC transporter ATP-binding protein